MNLILPVLISVWCLSVTLSDRSHWAGLAHTTRLQFCLKMYLLRLVTSHAGVIAKYCDEHVYVCVFVSVCPRGYFPNHTRDVYQIFMHVSYGRGSVLLRRAGWRNPKAKGQFWGFLPHWQCIVQHSIWDPIENGLTDRDAVWDDERAWPEEQCVT